MYLGVKTCGFSTYISTTFFVHLDVITLVEGCRDGLMGRVFCGSNHDPVKDWKNWHLYMSLPWLDITI